jgi:hypothetical protein
MTQQPQYPKGWDEARVKRVLDHYEAQSEDEAVAEDEAAQLLQMTDDDPPRTEYL